MTNLLLSLLASIPPLPLPKRESPPKIMSNGHLHERFTRLKCVGKNVGFSSDFANSDDL